MPPLPLNFRFPLPQCHNFFIMSARRRSIIESEFLDGARGVFDKISDILFLDDSESEESRPALLSNTTTLVSSSEDSNKIKDESKSEESQPTRHLNPSETTAIQRKSTASFLTIPNPSSNSSSPSSSVNDVGKPLSVASLKEEKTSALFVKHDESLCLPIEESKKSSKKVNLQEAMVRSTPMARMRSDAVAIATELKENTPPTTPQLSGQEVIANKQKKWRRHLKEHQRRNQEKKGKGESRRATQHNYPSTFFRALGCGYDEASSSLMASEISSSESSSCSNPLLDCSPLRRPSSPTTVRASTSLSPSRGNYDDEKNFIKSFIREASQNGLELTWHQRSSNGNAFVNPIEIKAFIEFGCLQDKEKVNGPRLAWYDSKCETLGSIDLVEIRSIARASPLQLNEFPFAIPRNSLILKFHHSVDDLVLETHSPESSSRFIQGLHWGKCCKVSEDMIRLYHGNSHLF